MRWQSKLVLLLVLPFVATSMLLDCVAWLGEPQPIVLWTLGLCALLGLVTWKVRAATPAAAATGAVITASLMFSTVTAPYAPWHTALVPTLAVALLAFVATRAGRRKKERRVRRRRGADARLLRWQRISESQLWSQSDHFNHGFSICAGP